MHQSFEDTPPRPRTDSLGRNIAHRQTTRSRVAARYAYLARVSLSQAARDLGLAVQSVAEAWARMYPGEPALVSRRTRPVVNSGNTP